MRKAADYIFGLLMLGGAVLMIGGYFWARWVGLSIRVSRLSEELADEDDLEEYQAQEKLAWRLCWIGMGMVLAALAVYGLEQLF